MTQNRTRPHRLDSRQRGAALVAGLVFLVILVMLGLSASSAAIQQEIIVRNIRDEKLAFQATEAALRAVDTWLRKNGGPASAASPDIRTTLVCTGAGKCEFADASWWAPADLNAIPMGQNPEIPAFADPGVAEQPAYIIELMPSKPTELEVNSTAPHPYDYVITVRGVGANKNTVHIFRGTYRWG